MVKKPFFSILIPTYNRAEDLQFALFCIFGQTFSDFEVVISDNCSTDNTEDVVHSLKDKRIRYYKTKTTLGNALNMNNALMQAKGKYVFFHSDDDFLLYKNSLEVIYKKIIKYNPGFIRLNYVSLSIDKKRIFNYKSRRSFIEDIYMQPHLENKKIISFILKTDPYFITGIIFKNSLPNNIKIIDSDPAPWFEILFYIIKNYGAYFVVKPHIIARWSRREMKKNAAHHIFSLYNEKLRSENYLNAVKNKLSEKEYKMFIHNELILLYVIMFHVIKYSVGNRKMINLANRISSLDPLMKKSIIYWTFFISALLLPRIFLKFARATFLYIFSRFSRIDNNEKIIKLLKNLVLTYLNSRKSMLKIKDPIFNFY